MFPSRFKIRRKNGSRYYVSLVGRDSKGPQNNKGKDATLGSLAHPKSLRFMGLGQFWEDRG